MKYLTQKQTTKLWSGLALAALLLTVLLWCLTSTVTFTPKQAIERAAKIEQIAPLTLLDEKEVPGFRLLLTGNQDNLVLLGWSDRYHHNLRNASNHLPDRRGPGSASPPLCRLVRRRHGPHPAGADRHLQPS